MPLWRCQGTVSEAARRPGLPPLQWTDGPFALSGQGQIPRGACGRVPRVCGTGGSPWPPPPPPLPCTPAPSAGTLAGCKPPTVPIAPTALRCTTSHRCCAWSAARLLRWIDLPARVFEVRPLERGNAGGCVAVPLKLPPPTSRRAPAPGPPGLASSSDVDAKLCCTLRDLVPT